MPRPTGARERELDERVHALAARNRRPGYDSTVTVRHVKPEPRARPKKRTRGATVAQTGYPGWSPEEKDCRREGCTNRFLPTAPAQAYCSIECKAEAGRAQRRITDKGKRERRRQADNGAPPTRVAMRICSLPGCDAELVLAHPNARYCSPEHREEATRKVKRRSALRARNGDLGELSPLSREVVERIVQLEERVGAPVPPLAREYLVMLWKRVNHDPDCPAHVYDRLERLLGLPAPEDIPAANGSTMNGAHAA